MRYDAESNEIIIGTRELVRGARRGICAMLPKDEDEPSIECNLQDSSQLSYRFTVDDYSFLLRVDTCAVDGNSVRIAVPVDSSPARPRKEVVAQARGEGYIAAFALTEQTGQSDAQIYYLYTNHQTGEENEIYERVNAKKLRTFFEKCKTSIKVYAKPEIERVTVRLPSMKGIRFPYENVRDGQHEIIRAVYKNLARGGTLFTTAPTGTGKTVSILFPAIRALGDERCDKIFYFTPKTTTARAARDCLEKLADVGAQIRCVVIPSKERICKNRTMCKNSRMLCANSRCNKLADAVIALYNTEKTVVSLDELWEISSKYTVCPHELALSYAELCDVVICDINYLFDPVVYIRRFFDTGGNYAFLVDEAHNLPDRAREMYSAEITEGQLSALADDELFPKESEVKKFTRVATESFKSILMPSIKDELHRDEDGNEIGAVHLSDIPYELYGTFDTLLGQLEDAIFNSFAARDEEAEARTRALREYYYCVKKFRNAMESFDSAYELFIFIEGGILRAKCYCIDPSRSISKRLEKGSSATFFSGTLSPMYYYRAVLGNDRTSDMLEVESPFDPSQISVMIMDKISTRLSERDDTLGAVCKAIAAAVSAKRGNYMIFSPSFAYSEALARVFKAKYPKIRVLEQRRDMGAAEKRKFLEEFEKGDDSYLIGFCVMGGIYSEGVDLAGDSLIGAIIIGIGIPALSYEREAICAYYNEKYEEGKQFAYIYPGMNRVLQAAGRVIRREDDKGVVVLIDDRFDDPIYRSSVPKLWNGMKFISDPKELRAELDKFWKK